MSVHVPCEEAEFCANTPERLGEKLAKCSRCRLSPENVNLNLPFQYWRSIDGKRRHPVLEAEKIEQHRKLLEDRRLNRLARDRGRQQVLRKAEQAERKTNKNIIQATKNSGRSNRDGDHRMGNQLITLDTKNQTTRDNPVVQLHELDKVREDSGRGGTLYGALLLRNKNGRGVVVMDEADFARLTEGAKQ